MLQSIRDAYADLQQVIGQRGELHLLYGIKADLLNDWSPLIRQRDCCQLTRSLLST